MKRPQTARRAKPATPAPPEIERQGETARVYEALKSMILNSELPPGAFVLHEELALRLGVSRTPIREAMIRLEQERLIEIKPRHGMRIVPISIDDMREIYQLLTALEAMAAELVAGRGLDTQELKQLVAAVDDMDTELKRDDLDAWSIADARFHALLVRFSGNRRLEDMVASVVEQSHRVRRLTLRLRPKPVSSNADHRALVEAIRKRDARTAYRVHHKHRQESGAVLIEILERLNLNSM